jgi:hypothetical protein
MSLGEKEDVGNISVSADQQMVTTCNGVVFRILQIILALGLTGGGSRRLMSRAQGQDKKIHAVSRDIRRF